MLSRFHLIPERYADGQTDGQICYTNIAPFARQYADVRYKKLLCIIETKIRNMELRQCRH